MSLPKIIAQLDERGIITHCAETIYKIVELGHVAHWQALHVYLSLQFWCGQVQVVVAALLRVLYSRTWGVDVARERGQKRVTCHAFIAVMWRDRCRPRTKYL